MRASAPIAMEYIIAGNRKLLVGRCEERIEPDSYMVFHRVGDAYWIQVIEQSGNQSDPASLASFLPVELVDANELVHVCQIALAQRNSPPAIVPPKSKRKTVRQEPPGSVPAESVDKSVAKPTKRSRRPARRVAGDERS